MTVCVSANIPSPQPLKIALAEMQMYQYFAEQNPVYENLYFEIFEVSEGKWTLNISPACKQNN